MKTLKNITEEDIKKIIDFCISSIPDYFDEDWKLGWKEENINEAVNDIKEEFTRTRDYDECFEPLWAVMSSILSARLTEEEKNDDFLMDNLYNDIVPSISEEIGWDKFDDYLYKILEIDQHNDIINPKDRIKEKFETRQGKRYDYAVSKIFNWLTQWDYSHSPRYYTPYKNGNYVYFLTREGGAAIVPNLFPGSDDPMVFQLEEIDMHYTLLGWISGRGVNSYKALEKDEKLRDLVFEYIRENYKLAKSIFVEDYRP